MNRRDSSTASAARFFKLRGYQPPPSEQRVFVNMSRFTLDELIQCVRTTIKLHENIGADVPHITSVALRVLLEAQR